MRGAGGVAELVFTRPIAPVAEADVQIEPAVPFTLDVSGSTLVLRFSTALRASKRSVKRASSSLNFSASSTIIAASHPATTDARSASGSSSSNANRAAPAPSASAMMAASERPVASTDPNPAWPSSRRASSASGAARSGGRVRVTAWQEGDAS